MNRFKRVWLKFRQCAVPSDYPPELVEEAKANFYAGALAVVLRLYGDLDPVKNPLVQDQKMLDDILVDLKAFVQEMNGDDFKNKQTLNHRLHRRVLR